MGCARECDRVRFGHLSRLFYDWGWEIRVEQYVPFCDYLKEMLKRNRVMVIKNDEEIEAVIMFYITEDYTKIYKKATWDIVNDNIEGHQVYIDKLVCKKFTRPMRESIEAAITDRFPNITEAIYHRAPKDRCVKIKRRVFHHV